MYILKSKFWVEEKKVSSMSERITNFLMKILIFPIILFFIYGVAWIIGMRIAGYIYKVEDIFFIVLMMVITSILCLILTGISHFIIYKIKPNIAFKNWFEWWHLLLMYISTLITVIIALKPIIEESGIVYPNIGNDKYAVVVSIFFLITFNYYFYKALVINKDIVLIPYIKEMIKKYLSIDILVDNKEKITNKYFQSWSDNDISAIEKYFSNSIILEESCGQVYVGLDEIKDWFKDWHNNNKVIFFEIIELNILDERVICQWEFKSSNRKYINEFKGVSIITFNNKNKIIEIKEYMTKIPITYHYL